MGSVGGISCLLFCLCTLVEGILQQTPPVLKTPVSTVFEWVLDLHDQYRQDLAEMFAVDGMDYWGLNRIKVALRPLEKLQFPQPSVDLVENLSYDVDYNRYRPWERTFVISGFHQTPVEWQGRSINYCLFAWDPQKLLPEELPEFDKQYCLQISIKVVNASLDYRNLEARNGNAQFYFRSSPHAARTALSTLTQGLLPMDLSYSLDCKSSAAKKEHLPELVFNNQSLKQEVVSKYDIKGFPAMKKYYVKEHIVGYDSNRNVFLIVKATASYEPVRSFSAKSPCLEVLVLASNDLDFQFYIFCVAQHEIELFEVTPINYLDPSGTGNTMVRTFAHLDKFYIEGSYRACQMRDSMNFFRYADLVCKVSMVNNSTGEVTFDTHYQFIEIKSDPVLIKKSDVLSISVFEEYYSKTFNISRSEFSLKLADFGMTNYPVFAFTNLTRNTHEFLIFECDDILKQEIFGYSHARIRVLKLPDLNFTGNDNPHQFCSTNKGLFVYGAINEEILFYPITYWHRVTVKHLGGWRILLNTTSCHHEEGYLTTTYLNQTDGRIVVVSSNTLGDSLRRHIADVPFYLGSRDYALVYFKPSAVSLHFHSNTHPNGTLPFLLWTLNLREEPSYFQVKEPNTYHCKLLGSPPTNSELGSTINFTIVVDTPNPLKIVRKKGNSTLRIKVPTRNDILSTEIDLEQHFNITGQIKNAFMRGSKLHNDDNSSVSVTDRLHLKYTFDVKDRLSDYSSLVWIHNRLVFGVRGNQIDVLVRESNSTEFKWNSTLDYMSKSAKVQTDDLVYLAHRLILKDNQYFVLVVGFFSRINSLAYQGNNRLGNLQYILVQLADMTILASASEPEETFEYDMRDLIWHVSDLRTVSPDKYELAIFSTQRVNFFKLQARLIIIDSTDWVFIFQSIDFFIGNNFGTLAALETYWGPNNTLRYVLISSLRSSLSITEFEVPSKPNPTLLQIVSDSSTYLPRLQSKMTHLNCTLKWMQCISAFESNHLTSFEIFYDEKAAGHKFSPSDMTTLFPQSLGAQVSGIGISNNYFSIRTTKAGGGVYIYERGQLAYPMTHVPEPYQSTLPLRFGSECELSSTYNCSGREVMLQAHKNSSMWFCKYLRSDWSIKNTTSCFSKITCMSLCSNSTHMRMETGNPSKVCRSRYNSSNWGFRCNLSDAWVFG